MDAYTRKEATMKSHRSKRSPRTVAALCVLVACLLFASNGLASMWFAFPAAGKITVAMYADSNGEFTGGYWTAKVGPVRLRDKHVITGTNPNTWAGLGCKSGPIGPCHKGWWFQAESEWAKANGNYMVTVDRTDTDWQPGDQVCEGSAFLNSFNMAWIPAPGNVSILGSCSALPDPRPVTCQATAPTTLAHGDVPLANVSGDKSMTTSTVTCNGSANVNVWAIASAANPTSTVPVRTDGSITSKLTVNGVDGKTGVTIPVTANQPASVTLGSTLASSIPTPGTFKGNATLIVDVLGRQTTTAISVTGNVVKAPTPPPTAPRPVMVMTTAVVGGTSKLHITWSWSTSLADYGSDTVPANYLVGLFVRNDALGKWHAFKTETGTAASTWGARIQRFHDINAGGGIEDEAPGTFESGVWCVRLAAASTPDTGGRFLPAPGAAESCVTVP